MTAVRILTRGERAAAAKSAHAARLAAVQALYQIDISNASAEQVIAQFAGPAIHRSEDARGAITVDTNLFTRIVRGVAARRAEIDEVLNAALSRDVTLDRLEVVMRALLRAGAFEMLGLIKPPARVVIAEYVALAGRFFPSVQAKLVNGILDRIGHVLRPDEFAPRPGEHVEPA